MAIKTECQTPGARFHTAINKNRVRLKVTFGRRIVLSAKQAEELEANLHNAVELVLARYYNA